MSALTEFLEKWAFTSIASAADFEHYRNAAAELARYQQLEQIAERMANTVYRDDLADARAQYRAWKAGKPAIDK